MRLSQVLLRIEWERPGDTSMPVSHFEARTTDGYVIPRFHGGLTLIGNHQNGIAVTVFIRPDKQVHLSNLGIMGTLFDDVVQTGHVDFLAGDGMGVPDRIHAWVIVEGEIVMRGVNAGEQFSVVRVDDVLYSDNPENVLILTWLRFLTAQEQTALESHMGQP
jgi:hypothetical protein